MPPGTERPLGNHLGQIEVRPSRAPKTYDDLMADLESASNASRKKQEQQQDDAAAISHDDLAHAPNFMPEISLHDKVGDTLSLLEGVMKPAPKEEYRPVLDVDDILGNKSSGASGRGAPITSLEEVRRLKQRQKADAAAVASGSGASVSAAAHDRGASFVDGESLRTITRPSAAVPTRKRRKAGGSNGADDAPVRIIREPESPAIIRQPAAAPLYRVDDDEQRQQQQYHRTPPSTPPRDASLLLGSGGNGSAVRSQTRTGRTKVTF